MNKLILAIVTALIIISCNNSNDKKHEEHKGHNKEIPATKQDSLMADVMAGHDEVMPKIGKVKGAQKEAQRLLDSVAGLSAKAQAAAAGLQTNLRTLIDDLNYADFAMDKWMVEFSLDSMKDNVEQRIKYLADEKMKVNKVKDAILNSLANADSLLKKKF
jgi:hypothetical protein